MDSKDIEIILLLFNNSRLTYREISENIGLSVNAIHKRVQALLENGIIEKFEARLKPYAINALYIFIFGQSDAINVDNVIKELGTHENTWQVILSSRNFFYIGAMLKDIHQLGDYSAFVSQIAKIQSPTVGILSGVYYTSSIPYIVPPSGAMQFDKLDLDIIRALRADSRKPVSEIAELVKSTTSTVRRRLSRLIEEGIIDLSINFNPKSSNDIFSLFQITIDSTENVNQIARDLNKKYNSNLFYCWIFSNLPNTILCWSWCNTMKELEELLHLIKKEKINSISFDIIYNVEYFDTWKERMLG